MSVNPCLLCNEFKVRLDVLSVFCSLNDSMILFYNSERWSLGKQD